MFGCCSSFLAMYFFMRLCDCVRNTTTKNTTCAAITFHRTCQSVHLKTCCFDICIFFGGNIFYIKVCLKKQTTETHNIWSNSVSPDAVKVSICNWNNMLCFDGYAAAQNFATNRHMFMLLSQVIFFWNLAAHQQQMVKGGGQGDQTNTTTQVSSSFLCLFLGFRFRIKKLIRSNGFYRGFRQTTANYIHNNLSHGLATACASTESCAACCHLVVVARMVLVFKNLSQQFFKYTDFLI